MILKLGYTEKDGINVFRYIENFSELKITSFLTRKYKYYPENNIIVYDKKHEILKCDLMFNIDAITRIDNDEQPEKGEPVDIYVCVTHINFLDNKTNTYQSYACLSDSVYLLNDNGKTIDKY